MQNCIDVRDGTHDTPKYVNNGIPLITSKNLSSGFLNFTQVQYISIEDHILISARSKVNQGDILFAMIGSIGNPVIVDTNIKFSIKNVALFKNLELKQIHMPFVYFYLSLIQKDLRTNAKGGNQPFVSLAALRNVLISVPPYKEQCKIAQKVTEIFLYLDSIESIIKGS